MISLFFLSLWNFYILAVERPKVTRVGIALANSSTEITPQNIDSVETILNRNPINQPMVNQYYTMLRRLGQFPDKTLSIEKSLAALGWRDTASQQNLIISAIERRDIGDIVVRADGLLRRNKLQAQALNLLLLAEKDRGARKLLWQRLAKNPIWRSDFFNFPFELGDASQVAARIDTLRSLQASGEGADRIEAAMSLYKIEYSGDYEAALMLTKAIRKEENQQMSLDMADPRFTQFTKRLGDGTLALPFEWSSPASDNVNLYADTNGQEDEVRIRWNGKGSEVLLRKRYKVDVNQNYRLTVSMYDVSEADLNGIKFEARCEDGSFVSFTREKTGAARLRQQEWTSDTEVQCRFPLLELTAKDSGSSRPVDLTLLSIKMERLIPARAN